VYICKPDCVNFHSVMFLTWEFFWTFCGGGLRPIISSPIKGPTGGLLREIIGLICYRTGDGSLGSTMLSATSYNAGRKSDNTVSRWFCGG